MSAELRCTQMSHDLEGEAAHHPVMPQTASQRRRLGGFCNCRNVIIRFTYADRDGALRNHSITSSARFL